MARSVTPAADSVYLGPGQSNDAGLSELPFRRLSSRLGSGPLLHTKCQIINTDLYTIIEDIVESVHMLFHTWEDLNGEGEALKWGSAANWLSATVSPP